MVVEIAKRPDELLACIKSGFVIVNYRTGHVEQKVRIWEDEKLAKRYDGP